MEQTARDQLVAPGLVAEPDLAASVLAARTRGVTVILSSDDDADPAALEVFQAALTAVVSGASERGVIRAKWRPRGDTLGTVVVTGSDLADSDVARWRAAGRTTDTGVRLELSRDEDSVLLELVAS